MKVALYCPSIGMLGCPERTIREIVARSRHEWLVITHRYQAESTFADLRQAPIVESSWRRKLPLGGSRALVVLSGSLADLINLRRYPVPVICLCFSPLRSAFDPEFQQRYLDRLGYGDLRRALFRAGAAGYRALDRFLWRRYSRVFAISGEVRQRIAADGLRSVDAVDVLHPGVDTDHLTPDRSYGREFLVPGRIVWHKNIELAIDAFRSLVSRRPNLSDYRLTIAGAVESRDYMAALRTRAAACAQIRFLEAPSERKMLALCREAYTIVYPQCSEGWGLLALEAMMLRRPVIALNRGGCREIVVHGRTGLLVDPAPEAVSAAMEYLADNPMLVRSMRASGRERALQFDWRYFCERLDESLDEAAGEPHLRARAAAAAC